MKCCNCGSSNVVKVKRECINWGDGGSSYVTSVEEYICLDCGRLMTFSPNLVEIIKTRLEELEKLKNEVKGIKKEIEVLENDLEFKKICDRKSYLESQTESIDITIRQKQEYEEELSKLQKEYRECWRRCGYPKTLLEEKLKRNEEKIKQLKSNMKEGNWDERRKN